MLKGAVFDLDGVLVDTEYYQWQGWVEVLKPYGISFSKEEYYNYAGRRGDLIEEGILREHNLDVEKGLLLGKKEKLLMEWFESKKLELMPYTREAIEFFIDRKLRVAVASTAPKDEVKLKLKNVGLTSLFPLVITGNDVERGKPYPDIYLLTVEKLGLKPEECISFEDTQHGVESAKTAGLTCLAIPGEYTRKQDFSKADGIFPSLREAVDWAKEKT